MRLNQMNQLLLLTNNNVTRSMRSVSNWKKKMPINSTSYIESLESKMENKVIDFYLKSEIKRDPYMEHLYEEVLESKMNLELNNLEKSTESLLRGIPLNTKCNTEVLTT
jgi:hypothetical protein